MNKFSHSSMKTFRRCKYQFYLSYVEGYGTPPSAGQARGDAGHLALAHWYRSSERDDEKALEEAWKRWQKVAETPDDFSQFQPLEDALKRYFAWARDRDAGWEMLATELNFEVKLGDFWLVGFIDGIFRYRGQIWLLENKFNTRVETKHLDLDPQVTTYMIGAYLSGYSPLGVVYNIVRMGDGATAQKEPVVRKQLYRNKEGLNAKIREMHLQMEEMHQFTEEGGSIYRNETPDCSWDCPYFQVCLSIQDNGDADTILSTYRRKEKANGEKEEE